MGQALYRKYRSKSLSEIVGQDHITQTLSQALKHGRVSHAYLFTGPRGVGKTSIARILAHEINNLEYSDENLHIDIIEIDAASNRRIDEIRDLRDKVYIAPTSAKYKVYIIDEVHMLTREAFNALLKTLEEPPEHVVFILATTDAHKLPETIVSRTQRFSFKPVPKDQVAAHLKQIAKSEKIEVTDEALDLLAEHGEGSFRDSISMLDQASSYGDKLDAENVRQLLGIPPVQSLEQVLVSLESADSAQLMTSVTSLYDQGFQAASIAKELSQLIRAGYLSGKLRLNSSTSFELLNRLLTVSASQEPDRLLEIILLEAQSKASPASTKPAPKPVQSPVELDTQTDSNPEHPASETRKPANKDESNSSLNQDQWAEVMKLLKKRHNTLYGIVRMAEPQFNEDGSLTLAFTFAFHQKRINEAANQKALAAIINEVAGKNVVINCILDKSASPTPASENSAVPKPAAQDEDMAAISNIFGGGELLES